MRSVVERVLHRVRKRVQTERLLKGVALLLSYGLVASLASTYVLARMNFSEVALMWARIIFGLGFLLLLAKFVVIPLVRPPSKRKIARFLEERYPLLRNRVSTAIELEEEESALHSGVERLVQDDARKYLRKVRRPRFYWPKVSGISLTSSVASILVIAVVYFGGPEVYRYSLNKLAWNWIENEQPSIYQVVVTPGNTVVGERADLEVNASLVGFEAESVRISVRYEKDPQWETARMVSRIGSPGFSFLFFDIREAIDYYVEADGITSDTYTVEVSDLPRVETVNATLSFPSYTGMNESTYELAGPIRALEGTLVRLEVVTSQPVKEGVLRFKEAQNIELTPLDPTRLEASFKIVQDDLFRIHLTNLGSVASPGSDKYLVEALDDQPPFIKLARPGRDKKVTNIEEVYTELRAEDDFGIRELVLRYSINGGPEQVGRPGFRRGTRQVTTSETLYLEEMNLQPGDFVSYYAEASDAIRSNTTDIYFLEVQPFSREVSQSQRAPGGGEQRDMGWARQQKQIVVATFSLIREREDYSEEELKENSMTLALLQQRLQTQVTTVAERIRRRETAMADPRLQKMTEYLEAAAGHMQPAEEFLAEVEPSKALPDEKRALQDLMRSEALFTEVEVAMSDSSSGGEGSLDDMVDLVDLELDRTKNQYETFQAGRREQREEALDDALEKLKELSKRQEQSVDRQKQDGHLSGEALAEEIQKLSRQLARLSREERDSQLSKLSQELERAARDMRRSLSSGQGKEASLRMAQQAMQRLEKAQEALGRQRRNQTASRVEGLQADAQKLVDEQEIVLDELRELDAQLRTEQIDQEFLKKHRSMLQKKGDVQAKLQELEGELHQAARQLDARETAAARKLRQIGQWIRDERLPEKMEEGSEFAARGLMNMALRREEGIGRELKEMTESISGVKQLLGQGQSASPQERRREALGNLGDLVEKLDSLKERLRPGQTDESTAVGEPATIEGAGGEGEARTGQVGGSRQLQREWNERLDEVAELREMLGRDPEWGGDVNEVLRRMRQMDLERMLGDDEEVKRLKAQVIDSLLQLELEISRSLQGSGTHYFRPTGEDEVTGEFRESVEEYHRRLSANDR